MTGKFKLITGLGNKDANKVKDLVLLWMKAGADIFDTSCNVMPDVQKACVENGFKLNDYDFCVSVPIEGDIHGKKAIIDPIKCKQCNKCVNICPQNAIIPPVINEKICIGCSHCKKNCKYDAIHFVDDKSDALKTLLKTDVKIDTVEVHISIKDKKTILKEFKKIIKMLENVHCKISVCFNRTYFSNIKTEKILKKLSEIAFPHEFIVQADGMSMNGGNKDLSSTIETVAFGLFVKSLGYNVILSGGCNEHTAKLAHDTGLKCSIGFGSFARKLTENLNYEDAVKKAKDFVLKTKEFLDD